MRERKSFITAGCLTALAMIIVGCAPATPGSSTPTVASKSSTAGPAQTPTPEQPRYGGILNRSIRGDISHFDIHNASSSIQLHPISPAYSGLVQYDPFVPNKVVPELANDWTVSSDGLVYTFNLRKGVKWHDGVAVSSHDVALSLERLRKNVHVGPGLQSMKSVEVVDEHTVRVHLIHPSSGLLTYLAIPFSAIFPKHVLEKKGNMKDDVMGTGAFKFKEFDRGVSISLVRNPDYFLPGRPYLDGVRTYIIADESTAMAALRTGRVDYMIWLSDAGAMRLRENVPEAKTGQLRGGMFHAIYLPVDKPPFNDVRVRKAVNLVIDRNAAVKVISEGMGEVGSLIPETLGGIPVQELLQRPGYRQPKDVDIAEAKRLMAEAGYSSGFKISTLHRKGTAYENQAVFMRDQLAKLGIGVALKTVDDAHYYELREKRAYETFSARHSVSINEPELILLKWFKSGVPENWSNFSDAELDKLIDLVSKEQDIEKRKAVVRQANERLEELAPAVMLVWTGAWRAWGPRLRDYVLPAQHLDAEKFVHVWLAK